MRLAAAEVPVAAESETGGGELKTASSGGQPTVQLATELPVTGQEVKFPEMASGMEAAMEAINAEGGVNGDQLSLNVCDTKYSANGEVDCARQIAAEEPAAVVAPFIVADSSGAAWPIFEKAGLPAIGSQGATLAELNSPNAFLISSGFVGPYAGTVNAVEAAGGAKKVTVVTDDPDPVAKPVDAIIEGQLKSHGFTEVESVTAHTQSDPTYATAVAEVLKGNPEAIIMVASPTDSGTLLQGLSASGYEGIIVNAALILTQQVIEGIGAPAEGVYLTNEHAFISDEKNPGIAKFKEDMAKYQPEAAVNDVSLQGWSGMMLFAEAAKGAKAMESKALMEAFEAVKKPIELKTVGPWSVVGKLNQIPGFSRIVNPTIDIGVVENGEVIAKTGFINPFAPPAK